MKHLIWTMTLSLLASTASFARGGESTGGGNAGNQLLPAATIVQTVANTKLPLYLFLHRAEARFRKGNSTPFLATLFGGSRDPFATLESMSVEARIGSDCQDSRGDLVDGSADASAQKICLSVDRLAKKLANNDGGQLEVAGLVVHEFSHLLGADEEAAQSVQRAFLSDDEIGGGRYFRFQSAYWIANDAKSLRRGVQEWLLPALAKLAAGPVNQDSWKELDQIATGAFSLLEDVARHYKEEDHLFGRAVHARPEAALSDIDASLVSGLFFGIEACALARSPEKPWSYTRSTYKELRYFSGYACREALAPVFGNARSVRLSRFFAFAKGQGLIPAAAELVSPIPAEPMLQAYSGNEMQKLVTDLQRYVGDESMPGSMAHLVKELERLSSPEFSQFRLVR